ncbi:unnamed protein product [Colias eurytheme]|nr:unnamed protein product [Colias eurytheme]
MISYLRKITHRQLHRQSSAIEYQIPWRRRDDGEMTFGVSGAHLSGGKTLMFHEAVLYGDPYQIIDVSLFDVTQN